MKRILVTGASGFVGRALCTRLLAEEVEVRAALRRVGSLGEGTPSGCESVTVGEIGPETDWTSALAGVDCVVHTAARVHVLQERLSDPLAAFREVNVAGTQRLAEKAADSGVHRMIFISSIKASGEKTLLGSPFLATDPPAPEDAYGISKWEAEQALRRVAKKTGLEVVVVRPPLVYGPGVRGNFLRLVRLVECGWPLPFGAIGNKRSYIALDNLLDFLVRSVEHPGAAGQVFLVSDGYDLSTPELIRGLAVALDRRVRLLSVPPAWLRMAGRLIGRNAELERLLGTLQVDISAACKALDWAPPITVEEGMHRMASGMSRTRTC